MDRTIPSRGCELSLADVIARLSRHRAVEGLLTIGTTRGDRLTPASDYDIVVVLGEMPAPLHVGLTRIDGRLTDLLFVRVEEVRGILEGDTPVGADSWRGRVVRWLREGEVVWDRSGLLGRARAKALEGGRLEPPSDAEVHGTWFGAYYNLQQTLRIATSDDPVLRTAVDIRLLYSLAQLWVGYFTVRSILWEGEQATVRWMAARDPGFLALYRDCLAEGERTRKLGLYERLVHHAMAPIGRWPDGATSIALDDAGETHPETIEAGLRFWDELLGG